MRISEPTLAMFIGELKKFGEHSFQITEAGERYLVSKKQFGPTHYTTKNWRDVLELKLNDYKLHLGRVYDLMHDRGLTNFESGYVDNLPPKYHPLRVDPKPDPDQLLEFALIMRLNPTLNVRGLNGKSTINSTGSDRHSSEGKSEEAQGYSESSTDLQSPGVTGSSERLQEQAKASDHKGESSESYALSEYLF